MKILKTIGLSIFVISGLALFGYGVYQFVLEFFWDAEVPLIIKIGLTGLAVGFLITIITLIIERVKDKKNETFTI